MSTYRKIHGRSIQAVTTDPTESVAEGQVWYNTTSDTFKTVLVNSAWASSGGLSTGRAQAGGNGTQDSALICGGYTTAVTALTEEYGGTGWSAGGNLTTSRSSLRSAGTQTSAIAFGGYKPSPGYITVTESYNGTSWTNSPSLNTGRTGGSQAGTSTAALYAGGGTPGTITNSEEYNGSSWSEGNNLNTARTVVGGSGIQTAALAAGGELGPPGYTGATENYDGTSWTTSPGSLNVIKGGQGQSGTQTSSLAYGGYTGTAVTGATESWDGTTWTNLSPVALATSRNATQGAGANSTSAVCFGGDPQKKETEEFTSSANVITAGAWASGGSLNTGRYGLNGFGATQNAAVAFVGRNTPIYNKTEEYNGTSWTEVNNYPTSVNDPGGTGTLTAGLGLGGLYPNDIGTFPTVGPATYEYDGTNWTSGGSYGYNAWATEMAGTQTAAIASGGHNYPMPPGNRNNSAEYNGSSWTSGNNMSQVRAMFAAGGSQTASFACGGRGSPGVEDPINATEEYDGTNWSTGGNYLTVIKQNTAGGGPQTAAYMAGGTPAPPPDTTTTGTYDGTSWSTAPNLPAKQSQAGSTTNNTGPSNAMTFGGAPGGSTVTYEFTGETTAINVKTLTQS